ncbi:hypothetical protein BJV82DRAFT_592856 [Fennellomyces sp. T-0311]|nr:hypothetical protein BJV82DRAFT_592856 [Fennellomyces sp. T-0311]
MMATSLHSLPAEIMLLIADLLCLGDCHSCSQVSRQWYRIFRPTMYRSVDIDNQKKLDRFMKLESEPPSSSIFFPVSRCVRKFQLSHIALPKNLRQVESLDWRYTDPPLLMITQTLDMAYMITCLKLKFSQPTSLDIFAMLRCAPRLQTLVLDGYFKELATDELERLHDEAPETLTRLDLEGDALATDNHWIRSTPWSIRDLRLAYRWPDARSSAMWLIYLTYKYPRVQQLKLEGRTRTDDVASSSLEAGNRQRNLEDQVDQLGIQACGVFSRFHPDLESVQLMNLGLHSSLYRIMLGGLQQCRSIHLGGVEAPSSYSRDRKQQWLADLFASFQNRVEQLEIKMVCPQSAMNGLKQCRNLRELTISRTSGFITSRDHWRLSLDEILPSCPRLEKLTLRQVTIGSSKNTSTIRNHPLRVLSMEYVALTASVLESLGLQCPRLKELHIHHSKWINQCHRQNHVTVHMPLQELNILDVAGSGDVYTLEPHTLLAVNTPFKNRWYFNASSALEDAPIQVNTWKQLQFLAKMEQLRPLDEHDVASLEQHMEDLAIARALRKSTVAYGPTSLIKQALGHGYLTFHCKSIGQAYFNGARICF